MIKHLLLITVYDIILLACVCDKIQCTIKSVVPMIYAASFFVCEIYSVAETIFEPVQLSSHFNYRRTI
jgi:hypothetical protein